MDHRQNNRSVKAVSPCHCPATCALRSCCFNCRAGQSHKDNVHCTAVDLKHLLCSLTIECMSVCREGGVETITDVLYSVNMYIPFCVKRFGLSHVMDFAL